MHIDFSLSMHSTYKQTEIAGNTHRKREREEEKQFAFIDLFIYTLNLHLKSPHINMIASINMECVCDALIDWDCQFKLRFNDSEHELIILFFYSRE